MENPFDAGYYEAHELRTFGFAHVGEGSRIAKNCLIIAPERISLGENSRVDAFTRLVAASGHICLGNHVHIHTGCLLGGRGGIDIGAFTGVSHNVAILTATDDFSGHWMTGGTLPPGYTSPRIAPVWIGAHVPIGANCAIMPGVTIGEGAGVCAMSLITKNLQEWTLYHGNPARRVKSRLRDVLALERQLEEAVAA